MSRRFSPRRLPHTIWRSPTFTTWGSFGVRSLGLLVVTSLILTRFDTVEIAAFYLFAAILTLSMIVAQRVSLTFIRLFAFAMAGAQDLRPIREASRTARGSGSPDWDMMRKVFATSGTVYLATSLITVLVCLIAGLYGITNLVAGDPRPQRIWTAFAVVMAGAFIDVNLKRYDAALRGMNHVALGNRWQIVAGAVRVTAMSVTLLAGGGLVEVVTVMQLAQIAAGLCNRALARRVEVGRLARGGSFVADGAVMQAAWSPTWRGLIAEMSFTGVGQLSGVLFTHFAEPAVVATYLLSLRVITVVAQASQAPFSSHQPRFSRLRFSGEQERLNRLFQGRILISLALFAAGSLAIGFLARPALELLGSTTAFMPLRVWLAMGLFHLHDRFNILNLAVCATANHIVYHWHQLAAGILSVISILVLLEPLGLWGVVLATGLPRLIVLNRGPLMAASTSMGVDPLQQLHKTYTPVLLGYSLVAGLGWLSAG